MSVRLAVAPAAPSRVWTWLHVACRFCGRPTLSPTRTCEAPTCRWRDVQEVTRPVGPRVLP